MIVKDIKLLLAQKRTFVLLACLVLVAVVGILFGKGTDGAATVKLGIADCDRSDYAAILISYFEDNEVFNSYVSVVQADEPELKQRFEAGELDLYLVIPEGFTEKLIYIENTPIRAVIDSSDATKAVVYKNLLDAYSEYISSVEVNCQALYEVMQREGYSQADVDKVNVSISYELIFTALGKDDFFKRVETERFSGIDMVSYYVYSAIFLVIMYAGVLAGLSILEEKLAASSLRLRSSGVSYFRQLLSKLAVFGTFFSLVLAAVLLTVNAFSGMHFDAGMFLFTVAAVYASSLVFMLIALAMPTKGGYIVFANMLILITTICGGGIIPIMYLPETLARVARFTPDYWFIKGML